MAAGMRSRRAAGAPFSGARVSEAADYLIVGSGPAGVAWPAWPLVLSGARVLMIDGADDTMAIPRAVNAAAPWRHMLGARLEAVAPAGDASPKLETSLARAIADAHPDRGFVTDGFTAVSAVARGGLSTIWGGFVAEYDDQDFRGWPVSAAQMRPFYRQVLERIGASGSMDDDLSAFYGTSSALDARLAAWARRRRRCMAITSQDRMCSAWAERAMPW